MVEPNHLVNSGDDITLLELATPSTKTPAKVVGAGGTSLGDSVLREWIRSQAPGGVD